MLLVNNQSNINKSNVTFGIKVTPNLKRELAEYSKEWLSQSGKENLLNIFLDADDSFVLALDKNATGSFTERIQITSTKYKKAKASLADVFYGDQSLKSILKNLTPEKLKSKSEMILREMDSKLIEQEKNTKAFNILYKEKIKKSYLFDNETKLRIKLFSPNADAGTIENLKTLLNMNQIKIKVTGGVVNGDVPFLSTFSIASEKYPLAGYQEYMSVKQEFLPRLFNPESITKFEEKILKPLHANASKKASKPE